jgi:GT2 family glycosyltransferase
MIPKPKIRFVVASRHDKAGFLNESALGLSRLVLSQNDIEARLFADNRRGLPAVYNQAIEESKKDPAILVFVHDDLWILELFIRDKLTTGLKKFDLIGLAGSVIRRSNQPGWMFKNMAMEKAQPSELSGTVGHGKRLPPDRVSVYGPTPMQVKLLDGLFLACSSQLLIEYNLRFDTRFQFHFYDLDLCRQFELKGLRVGTWPISVSHQSGGQFDDKWEAGCRAYFEKWGD